MYNVYSSPFVLKVKHLTLLASPVSDRKYDKERDEALRLARKQETLRKLEDRMQRSMFDLHSSLLVMADS